MLIFLAGYTCVALLVLLLYIDDYAFGFIFVSFQRQFFNFTLTPPSSFVQVFSLSLQNYFPVLNQARESCMLVVVLMTHVK